MGCLSDTSVNILPWSYKGGFEDEACIYVPERMLGLPYPSERFKRHCLFFASHLVTKWHQGQCKRLRGKGKDHWAQLSFKWIWWLLTKKQASSVLAFLQEHGVIDIDRQYKNGEFSRHYRLGKAFRKEKVLVGFRNRPIWKKLNKMREMRMEKIESMPDKTREWLKAVVTDRVTVDFEEAMAEIDRLDLTKEQRSYYIIAVSALYRGDIFCVPGKKTGRLFSSVSNFPKNLRKFIRIDGKRLTELDLKCSQPLLLLTLYPEDCEERARLADILENDDFYDYIARVSEYEYEDRDKLKEAIYTTIFFGKNTEPGKKDRRLMIGFKKALPELSEHMRNIKSGPSDYSHCKLAIELQNRESEAIIDGASGELMGMDIPVTTIHDAVLCKPEHVEMVNSVMMKHLRIILQNTVEPTIKVNKLNEIESFQQEKQQTNESESMNRPPKNNRKTDISGAIEEIQKLQSTATNEAIKELGEMDIMIIPVHDKVLCKPDDRATVRSIVDKHYHRASFGFSMEVEEVKREVKGEILRMGKKEGKKLYRDMCKITPPDARNAEGIEGAIYLFDGMVILPSGEMECTDPDK